MRITPNHPRLRLVALTALVLGAWCVVNGGMLVIAYPNMILLTVSTKLLALLLLAIGLAFWQLSTDRRAGIVFDSKGLLLNLGHSSAFIAWDNIERVGVSTHRASLLSLGSRHQLGIMLKDLQPYVQSYEQRMPASRGPFSWSMRQIDRLLRRVSPRQDAPIVASLAASRALTGYDVLIPEAFVGGRASHFAELVDSYRSRPATRRSLGQLVWAQ